MAGYSKTPLAQKLGIKPNSRIALLNAPADYAHTLGHLPEGVTVLNTPESPLDLIQCFATTRSDLNARFGTLKAALRPDGALWISWPKRSSGMPTDINENVVREIGLARGLVDVKVCAVDEIWSGLKFVYRVEDRH
ncbi:MAG TPA: hypothetical protein VMT24_19180 [Aggregatilineaceae bacterium]|nr:hypothetical protein [Aggregatilineaceae bacterium]